MQIAAAHEACLLLPLLLVLPVLLLAARLQSPRRGLDRRVPSS
jgi:hypothetical protein